VYGIYSQVVLPNGFSGGIYSVDVLTGLSGDELQQSPGELNTTYAAFYANAVPSTITFLSGTTTYFWSELYNKIYACNSALEGINASTGMTAPAKQQLTGEVKFLRAFFYFYLVNLYGDLPLALSTDYKVNNALSRTPVMGIYAQMIADLTAAENGLGNDYTFGICISTTSRQTADKQVAAALLARVYLYTMNFQQAEQQATSVITDPAYRLEPDLNKVFLQASHEAIWQLQWQGSASFTLDASAYVLTPGQAPLVFMPGSMSAFLVNSFEAGDRRRADWVGTDSVAAGGTTPAAVYYYPYKYRVRNPDSAGIELVAALRLGEQYLIRAESRAQQGNLTGAAADLNSIRNRAGLPNTTATTRSGLLAAIYHERQVELFTEWGHRWFDLKRTGNIDSVMSIVCPAKGTVWNSYAQLYPIPINDIQLDPNLKQNEGY
jgi:hypothetical protein